MQFYSAPNQTGIHKDILLRDNLFRFIKELCIYSNIKNSQMLTKESGEAGNPCCRSQASRKMKSSHGNLRDGLSSLSSGSPLFLYMKGKQHPLSTSSPTTAVHFFCIYVRRDRYS